MAEATKGRPRSDKRKIGNRNDRATLNLAVGNEGFEPGDNVKIDIEKVKKGKAVYTVTKTR